jgi:Asp-tRNA(Asn)/Glu-tRNA(Gln) amidotransferase B subunit
VNISIAEENSKTFGTRCEVKNVTGIQAIIKSIGLNFKVNFFRN